MEVKITQLHRSDKDKQGNAYVGKNGKPYTRLGLKTEDYKEKWLSGFENFITKDWKVGDVVEIEVEKVVGKDGKEYLNFKTLSETGKLWTELNKLADRVAKLEANKTQEMDGYGMPQSEEEPDLSNLPF